MNTKQFLKKNEAILNFASMDAYCGFPAGTFSSVIRGKIKLSAERNEIFLSLCQRLAQHCNSLLAIESSRKSPAKTKKGHRK